MVLNHHVMRYSTTRSNIQKRCQIPKYQPFSCSSNQHAPPYQSKSIKQSIADNCDEALPQAAAKQISFIILHQEGLVNKSKGYHRVDEENKEPQECQPEKLLS